MLAAELPVRHVRGLRHALEDESDHRAEYSEDDLRNEVSIIITP